MTEERSIGYTEGYQDGWNAAMDTKASPQPPPAKVLLTTDEIRKVADKADEGQESTELMLAFARAIEQAVRQKAGLK